MMSKVSNYKITDALRRASDAYYNTGNPIITDKEFDKLSDYLKRVDPNNSFFTEVGAPTSAHREEVDLVGFMGSQLKVNTDEEAREWYNKFNNPELVVSDKLDGSSIEVVYIDGKMSRAVTRGNGKRGMSVTQNAKMWKGLPQTVDIKGQLVVRGEAQLSVEDYNNHFSDMANPRNAGNGIVVCDSGSERNRYITFHAFDIKHDDISFDTQSNKFDMLKSLGFNIVRWTLCKNWNDLIECRNEYLSSRDDLSFEIDGMVLDINNLAVREAAGYADNGTRPKGARAWKFSAETALSKVVSFIITLGSTGKIIPTVVIEPVNLAGTTVSHILLNNFDYIANKNVNIGDVIEVLKGGDIIPFCKRVVEKNSDGPYPPPKDWKGYPLTKIGKDWFVTDLTCPDLLFQRIKQWINKTGIKHVGTSTLSAMIESGMVKDIDDLYHLDYEELSKLPIGNGVVGSNSIKIKNEIDKTRKMKISTFIGSMSIKFLGRSRAESIGLNTIDEYLNLSVDILTGKKCSETGTFSSSVAQEVIDSIQSRRDIIDRLSRIIDIEPLEDIKSNDSEQLDTDEHQNNGCLSGFIFCFTGCRPSDALEEAMYDEGATIKSSVTKDCTHLICKDKNSTSNKARKARERGVEVIGMEDLEEMME